VLLKEAFQTHEPQRRRSNTKEVALRDTSFSESWNAVWNPPFGI
jgi:hypothetical protein